MSQKSFKKNFEVYQVFLAKCANTPKLYTTDAH